MKRGSNIRGSFVVNRGRSWSFVVIRGHSWSFVCLLDKILPESAERIAGSGAAKAIKLEGG